MRTFALRSLVLVASLVLLGSCGTDSPGDQTWATTSLETNTSATPAGSGSSATVTTIDALAGGPVTSLAGKWRVTNTIKNSYAVTELAGIRTSFNYDLVAKSGGTVEFVRTDQNPQCPEVEARRAVMIASSTTGAIKGQIQVLPQVDDGVRDGVGDCRPTWNVMTGMLLNPTTLQLCWDGCRNRLQLSRT